MILNCLHRYRGGQTLQIGNKRCQRGQAALIAVVLITGVALISAGFAAFIAASLHHMRQVTGKGTGRDLALYGLRYAIQQLVHSTEGADWRPKEQGLPWDAYEQRRGWNTQFVKYRAPAGHFLLRVVGWNDIFQAGIQPLGREGTYVQEGYIVVTSIGRPVPNSPVYHRIVALIPIPLVQYGRFVTAQPKDGINEILLGTRAIDFDANGTISAQEQQSSQLQLAGGIRINTSVRWLSNSINAIRITSNRDTDAFMVAGVIRGISAGATVSLIDISGGTIGAGMDSIPPANFNLFFVNNLPRYRDAYYRLASLSERAYTGTATDTKAPYRRVAPLPPPSILALTPQGANRYRQLIWTGSPPQSQWGYWFLDADGDRRYTNGEPFLGLYIDNYTDQQEWMFPDPSADARIELMRDWVYPADMSDARRGAVGDSPAENRQSGWWLPNTPSERELGRNPAYNAFIGAVPPSALPDPLRYVPPGVEILLFSTDTGITNHSELGIVNNNNLPDVVIIRHDQDETYQPQQPGDPNIVTKPLKRLVDGKPLRRPLLTKSVVSAAFDYVPNGRLVIFAEGNVRIRGTIDANLTVVSMGTIYIEGPLSTKQANEHIALLAKNHICFNTTAMLPPIPASYRSEYLLALNDTTASWTSSEYDTIPLHWQFPSSGPVASLSWYIARFDNSGAQTQLVIRHSGKNEGLPGWQDDFSWATIGYDDDGDGRLDEDPADSVDNDGDGKVDEDPINMFFDNMPLIQYDDDRDGQIDEDPIDGVDNDGDGAMDEDPIRPLYTRDDDDNDNRIDEDPLNYRDDDGDNQIDEDGTHGFFTVQLSTSPSERYVAVRSGRDANNDGIVDEDNDNDGRINEDWIDGVDNDGDGRVDEDPPERPYRLSRFKVELLDNNGKPVPPWNVTVQAIMYAERGCFFILPIPYFDGSQVEQYAQRFRRYNYFDITIRGAISEFATAQTFLSSTNKLPNDALQKAFDKLAYPRYDNNGNLIGWQLIRFEYDSTLTNSPLPPYLPVSPRPIVIHSGL